MIIRHQADQGTHRLEQLQERLGIRAPRVPGGVTRMAMPVTSSCVMRAPFVIQTSGIGEPRVVRSGIQYTLPSCWGRGAEDDCEGAS